MDWSATTDVPWITLTPDSNQTVNGCSTVTISIDVTGLAVGQHLGTVTIESPQATNGPLTIAVTLNIL